MSIKADKRTCLKNTFPLISTEWHPSKNGNLTPENVTAKSGKKVWWLCKEGHEWEALISNRTKNMSGCPYCAGKRAIVGVNDLQTVNPALAEEWHPTKNGKTTPADVMSSSANKYWWMCKDGHEWQASLDSRKRGAGCPFCSGRYAIEGKTDLLSQRPDIAALWHPTKNGDVKPNTVTVASGRMYWWFGACGHEWKTRVSTMCAKQGLEICPICSSENRTSFPEQAVYYYILQKFDDAVSRYSAHKKEIDVYIPSLSVGVEYDGMRYHTTETEEKEKNKDVYFQKRGIRIFRIKEYAEDLISHNDFTVYYNPSDNYKRLTRAIILLFELISEYTNVGFVAVDVNTARDNAAILSQFLKKKKENSLGLKHPSLLKEWDSEKNKGLNPMLIGEGSNQ